MAIFTADGHVMIEVFRDVRIKFAGNDRAKAHSRSHSAKGLQVCLIDNDKSVNLLKSAPQQMKMARVEEMSSCEPGDSGEAERSFRKESERHYGMIPNTIGA